MEVTTNGTSVVDPASETEVHPEDFDPELIEELGIQKVEQASTTDKTSDDAHTYNEVLDKDVTPQYVMTNCPWEAEVESTTVEGNRNMPKHFGNQ